MKLLWRLSKETVGYRFLLVLAVVITVVMTGLNLAVPRFQMTLVDIISAGVSSDKLGEILRLSMLLLGTILLRECCRGATNVVAHQAAWNIVEKVRVKIYGKMQTFTTEYFTSVHTGDLMSRVVSDTETLEQLYAHLIPETIANVITFVGVCVVLFTINPRLAALTCIPIPFIVLLGRIFTKKIMPLFRARQKFVGEMNTDLNDNFSGIQVVRAFGQEERAAKKVHKSLRNFTTSMLQALFKGAFFAPGVSFLTSCGLVIVLGAGGYFAYKNQVSISEVIGFVFYLGLFYAPISGLAQLMEGAQHAIAGAERVVEILDTPIEIQNNDGAIALESCEGALAFEDVSFHYEETKPILKNIDLEVKPGTFTALVGPTGVGKTTAVNLMARFYDPISGVIKLDGHDIKTLTLETLRKYIAFVPQDTFLFNTTLAENIAYARPDATREEIIAAAKIARIHDDIAEMPDGYESVTGERGVKLSGGQKQRVAIARAVLAGAPVLILDEATSSVDAETERMIQRSIDELTGTHTIVAIAHRLSTVINADQIVVFKDGEIEERGTHAQLMELGGLYRRMYDLQTAEENDNF
ncbi:MAG: ABC transporter ATP-binding protein/permease [Oscillospiraceae bacterium]|jgi:ATP-binding cassette subfamily B protein|nr:ABC transporter ATP-binding protein/permease [Oscillospiraceae bacterium]